jgi:hypothetical protein
MCIGITVIIFASTQFSLESLGVALLVGAGALLFLVCRLAVCFRRTCNLNRCYACSYRLDPAIAVSSCSECGAVQSVVHVRALRRRLVFRSVLLLVAAAIFGLGGVVGIGPEWLRQSRAFDHLLFVTRLDVMRFMSRIELMVERQPDVWFTTLTSPLEFGPENRGFRLDIVADEAIARGLAHAALKQPLSDVADGLLFQAIAYGSVPDELATKILAMRVRRIFFEPGQSSETGDAAIYERLLSSSIVLTFVDGIRAVYPSGSLGLVIGVRYVELITPAGPTELIMPPSDVVLPRGRLMPGERVPTIGQALSWSRSRPRDDAQPGLLGPRRESPTSALERVSGFSLEQLSIRYSIRVYAFGVPRSRAYHGELTFSAADLLSGVRDGRAEFVRAE